VPTPRMTQELRRVTGSRPGLVVDTVRSWFDNGRLVSTHDGLELQDNIASTADRMWGRGQLADVHDMLTGANISILEVLAVSDIPIGVPAIVDMLADPAASPDCLEELHAQVDASISTFEELGIVIGEHGGRVTLRPRLLRDAIWAWTRPATRRRLHRQAAERL